jgi:glucose/arabinose dehydrogenase
MGDGGLFSATFDPSDAAETYLYVQWLHVGDNGRGKPWVGDFSRVSRFTVDPANPNAALPGSEVVVFDHSTLPPGTVFHFGGSLVFGRDGLLYSAHGDYHGIEPQTITSSVGKVSRFFKNGTIPSDGPFYASGTAQGKAIFALGLRNPFATLVAPAVLDGLPKAGAADSSSLLIFDVGEASFEEIYVAVAGANGGWPRVEGNSASSGPARASIVPPLPASAHGTYMDPLFAWAHDSQNEIAQGLPASCCSTGGTLYSGVSFPQAWLGVLFFTDLCGGYIAYLPASSAGGARPTPRLFARGYNTPHGLITGAHDGALYIFSHNDGTVHRVVYAPLAAPVVSEQPASARVPLGVVATFSVSVALSSVSDTFSIVSQPGIERCSTPGSFNAAQTTGRFAGMIRSPLISIVVSACVFGFGRGGCAEGLSGQSRNSRRGLPSAISSMSPAAMPVARSVAIGSWSAGGKESSLPSTTRSAPTRSIR